MAVGPSAPPMMPMPAASWIVKPISMAPMTATTTPSCAAAPSRKVMGLASSGPKSVRAPIPIKMMIGYSSWSMPNLTKLRKPPGSTMPDRGRFTSRQPKAIGISSKGSKSFAMAR